MKLSENEQRALLAWENVDKWWCLNFRGVERYSGLEKRLVRRTVRALARKGLAQYERGLFNEDGETAGSGYSLTKEGYERLKEMQGRLDAAVSPSQ